MERYHQANRFTRHVNLQEVLKHFLRKVPRRVHEEFSDVQLDARFFQVDPGLRGDWVEVRYDPFGPLETVLIYSLGRGISGRGQAAPTPNCAPSNRRRVPMPKPKPKHNYLDLLIQKHEQALRDRHAGIDYQAVLAAAGRRWPFAEFVKQLAGHLGHKGGLTAFTTDELESLQKVYQRLTCLDAPMLREACHPATGGPSPTSSLFYNNWPMKRKGKLDVPQPLPVRLTTIRRAGRGGGPLAGRSHAAGAGPAPYLADKPRWPSSPGGAAWGNRPCLKRFLHELHGPRWQPVYLHLTHLSATGLFKLLVGKLGELPRRGKERLFEQILGKARQAEGGLLVILDEAHLIDAEALTDIRL